MGEAKKPWIHIMCQFIASSQHHCMQLNRLNLCWSYVAKNFMNHNNQNLLISYFSFINTINFFPFCLELNLLFESLYFSINFSFISHNFSAVFLLLRSFSIAKYCLETKIKRLWVVDYMRSRILHDNFLWLKFEVLISPN